MIDEKKKTKRINKIRNVSGIIALVFLISAIALACTSCSNSYPNEFNVNVDEETKTITVLADKDISDIDFYFDIDTNTYGIRREIVHFDEIKAHKLTNIELETTKNKEIEINNIRYQGSKTPLQSFFSNIGLICFFISAPFIIITLFIYLWQLWWNNIIITKKGV